MGVKFCVAPEGRIYVEGVRQWVMRKTRHCPTYAISKLHLKKEKGNFEIIKFLTRRIFSFRVSRIGWKNTAGR